MVLVLGIESTCDETAAAVVKDGKVILSNEISSQIDLHRKYNGVFPELAFRSHIDLIIPIIDESLKRANVSSNEIDLIAVANGPGLVGAVLIGVNVAKGLSFAWNKPLVGINHIEAHLYAAMMNNLETLAFPSLGVVISGGHTMLLKILDIGKYEIIGTTIDDAIGEAFDKVAAILDLPYPGGPSIEHLALSGDPQMFNFKPSVVKNNPFNFSFSGLKTKVLYTVRGQGAKKDDPFQIKEEEKKHIAASFQMAALSDIIDKTFLAAKSFDAKAVYLGGGVTNNKKLRLLFLEKNFSCPIFWPPAGLSLDNAAMIAGLGYQKYLRFPVSDGLSMQVFARAPSL